MYIDAPGSTADPTAVPVVPVKDTVPAIALPLSD
jgi:hypothetical protein